MRTIKGPAIFLAQFMSDKPPFHSLDGAAEWAAGLGFRGVQIPSWDARCIDLEQAAKSRTYCDALRGRLAERGLEPTELSTHLQGQLVAVHPAYDALFDGFAPKALRGKPKERTAWAVDQVKKCLSASRNLGLSAMATFSGALVWPYFYPWPQRPRGLVEEGFQELARRWKPILEHAERCGVDCAFEVHPGEDLHDGATFERFLEATGGHVRVRMVYDPSHFVLQQLDYLGFVDQYHDFIRVFHVKDAEYRPSARSGVYGGYLDWPDRPGRFRSLGDGQVDFGGIFTRLARHDYPGWAVLEWECAYKSGEVGAREGAEFIRRHIIQVADHAFDDFAGAGADRRTNRKVLGLA